MGVGVSYERGTPVLQSQHSRSVVQIRQFSMACCTCWSALALGPVHGLFQCQHHSGSVVQIRQLSRVCCTCWSALALAAASALAFTAASAWCRCGFKNRGSDDTDVCRIHGFGFPDSGCRVQGPPWHRPPLSPSNQPPRPRFPSPGFRIPGFGFRIPGFGFRVSCSRFRILGFGFRVRVSGFVVAS